MRLAFSLVKVKRFVVGQVLRTRACFSARLTCQKGASLWPSWWHHTTGETKGELCIISLLFCGGHLVDQPTGTLCFQNSPKGQRQVIHVVVAQMTFGEGITCPGCTQLCEDSFALKGNTRHKASHVVENPTNTSMHPARVLSKWSLPRNNSTYQNSIKFRRDIQFRKCTRVLC